MSTQIQVSPKSGITIGTTPITSGTIGRVLFEGAGNVVQESAGLTFSSTYSETIITNPAQFSGNQINYPLLKLTQPLLGFGNSSVVFRAVESSVNNSFSIALYKRSGYSETHFLVGGNGSGTNTETPFMAVIGDNFNSNGSLYINKSRVNIGYGIAGGGAGNLDIKSGGSLSTDIAFRVRNSADTANLVALDGTGVLTMDKVHIIGGGTNVYVGPATNKNAAGTSNVHLGYYAGYNGYGPTPTGYANCLVGAYAGFSISSGLFNTSIGYFSGADATSGVYNTFLGNSTARGIVNGSYNTIVGAAVTGLAAALSNNVILADGQANIAIWKNSSHFVGIGYNAPTTDVLGAKLDVRAQGALSTDIAFRVRNSADTFNMVESLGNGGFRLKTSGGVNLLSLLISDNISIGLNSSATLNYGTALGTGATTICNGGVAIGYASSTSGGDIVNPQVAIGMGMGTSQPYAVMIGAAYSTFTAAINNIANSFMLHLGATASGNYQHFFVNSNTNIVMRSATQLTTGTHYEAAATNTLTVHNGTAPTVNIVDAISVYSADQTAGNAAPHFRTENGSVIKLYKQDLPTNPTNAELATFLSNLGLANLI